MSNRELSPTGCQKRLYGGRGGSWQCRKKPVVTRDSNLYCRVHDPEYIKEKAARLREKWGKESARRHQQWNLDRARGKATEGLTLTELEQVTPDLIRSVLRNGQMTASDQVEAEANANLIASAKDLYEACKVSLDLLQAIMKQMGKLASDYRFPMVETTLINALSKAEGKKEGN